MNTTSGIDLTKNMVKVAELSSCHVQHGDMERIEILIGESYRKMGKANLDSIDGEAHLGFQPSYHVCNRGVFIDLGTVYSDDKLERELDYDVYVLCMENGFTREFGQLIVTLRKQGLSYAVLDGDAEVCPDLPTYEW